MDELKNTANQIRKIYKIIVTIILNIIPITITMIILILVMIFMALVVQQKQHEEFDYAQTKIMNISNSVTKHEPTIKKYMAKYNIPSEYLPFILAQAMQESSGKEPDIFQASESKYNGKIGMIKSAEESIEHAMKRWREIIDQIKEKELTFSIELVLQTYNYGSGYLNWVEKHGKRYTKENAMSFSKYQLNNLRNWNYSVYGDPLYIDHIFRYLNIVKKRKEIFAVSDKNIKTVLDEAHRYLNVPYQLYANNPPRCMDCSAFTMRVYKKIGINFSHSAQAQYDAVTNYGKNVTKNISELKIGDLVFFKGTYNTSNFITHVGIYIGGGKMINAQIPKVKIADIQADFGNSFVGGGSPWHLLKDKP